MKDFCAALYDKLKSRTPVFWLSGMVLLMFVCCVSLYFLEPGISRDGCLYLRLIRVWYEGGDFQAVLDHWEEMWIPPFHLYAARLLMYCGCSVEFASVGLNMVFCSFLPVIVYGIAKEICGDIRISLSAALLTALNPSLIDLAIEPQREIFYLFFSGLVIYTVIYGIKHEKWYAFFPAGIFWALSFLTRYESLEMLPLCIFVICVSVCGNWKLWKKNLLYLLIFCVSCGGAFTALIYGMGVQTHLIQSYEKYYEGKFNLLKSHYQEKEAK